MNLSPNDSVSEHDLAMNLRCLRKRLAISQEELAQRVGLNRGNIASYEKGSAEPKLCNLLRLSHLFGVSIHDLTRRDLSCDNNYQQATSSYLRLNSEEASMLKDFERESTELKEVRTGIVRCHAYILQKNQPLEGDARAIDAQFTQLAQVSEEMCRRYEQLLAFVKARIKS